MDLYNKYNQKLINILEDIVISNFDFNLAYNAKYTTRDIILATSYYASKNLSAESGILDLKLKNTKSTNKLESLLELCLDDNIASPDAILYQIKKQNINDFTFAFDNIVKELTVLAKKLGFLKKKVTLAIDFHDDPYYGDKNNSYVMGMKPKLGTSCCFRYASICVVQRKKRFTVGVLPINPLTIKKRVVEKLIRTANKYVKISKVLLDRGFYTVEVIETIKGLKIKYIMPAIKTDAMKKVIIERNNKKRTKVSEYSIKDNSGKSTKVKLIILKSKVKKPKTIYDKYFVLITNIKIRFKHLITQIPKEYRKRWGIETSYRVKHEFLAKTTCRKYTVRYYYFILSAILYNVWIILNLLACRYKGVVNSNMRLITTYTMQSLLQDEIIEYYDSVS